MLKVYQDFSKISANRITLGDYWYKSVPSYVREDTIKAEKEINRQLVLGNIKEAEKIYSDVAREINWHSAYGYYSSVDLPNNKDYGIIVSQELKQESNNNLILLLCH